jgi:hypothetical protein
LAVCVNTFRFLSDCSAIESVHLKANRRCKGISIDAVEENERMSMNIVPGMREIALVLVRLMLSDVLASALSGSAVLALVEDVQ